MIERVSLPENLDHELNTAFGTFTAAAALLAIGTAQAEGVRRSASSSSRTEWLSFTGAQLSSILGGARGKSVDDLLKHCALWTLPYLDVCKASGVSEGNCVLAAMFMAQNAIKEESKK